MKKLFVVASLLALTACGDAITYPGQLEGQTSDVSQTATTPVDQIQLFESATADGRQFEEIGSVSASVGKPTAFHPSPTVQQAEQKLRIEAAELGADAIVNTSISNVTICALSWGCRNANGTAVRFVN